MHLSMVFLRALRDGRDPADAARAADLGYIPSAMSQEQKKLRPYMNFAEANRLYLDDFVPALKISVQSDQALADAVRMLASNGECLFAQSGLVYLAPDYIARLVRPLKHELID